MSYQYFFLFSDELVWPAAVREVHPRTPPAHDAPPPPPPPPPPAPRYVRVPAPRAAPGGLLREHVRHARGWHGGGHGPRSHERPQLSVLGRHRAGNNLRNVQPPQPITCSLRPLGTKGWHLPLVRVADATLQFRGRFPDSDTNAGAENFNTTS